jgi:glyoxylase-like metal-dependent hydrolase (beta-lactamase superfamily II)
MRVLALALLAAAAGCAPAPIARAPESPVVPVRLGPQVYANAYLILGSRGPVVVDPGSASASDAERLDAALAAHGYGPADVVLVIATHAHADHAGGAARLQALGAPVLGGSADLAAFQAGHNDTLRAIGPEAAFVKAAFIREGSFPALTPDLLLRDAPGAASLDLRPYGVGGVAVRLPGHTPGSIAVLLDTGEALAGDIVRGGYMGGRLAPRRPLTHYFHADEPGARAAVRALLRWGATRLYVGHGGPLDADRLRSWAH